MLWMAEVAALDDHRILANLSKLNLSIAANETDYSPF